MLSVAFPIFGKRKKLKTTRSPAYTPTSYTDTKVGGVPIIPIIAKSHFDKDNPGFKCSTCFGELYLLFQACTPFGEQVEVERMIFIFSCNQIECSRSRSSVYSFILYFRKPVCVEPGISFKTKDKTNHIPGQVITIKPKVEDSNEIVYRSEKIERSGFTAYPIGFEDRDSAEYVSDSDDDDPDGDKNCLFDELADKIKIFDMSDSLGDFDEEEFENIIPRNIDPIFYNFEKKIQRDPWLVVLYWWDGHPLLAQSFQEEDKRLQCKRCQAPLIFECQLLPALLHLLQVEHDGMEWSTILIYSCSMDCGAELFEDVCHIVPSQAIIQYE